MLLKINYSAVAVSNYQGGAGETFFSSAYVNLKDDTTISDIKKICEDPYETLGGLVVEWRHHGDYADENIVIRSLELIFDVKTYSICEGVK